MQLFDVTSRGHVKLYIVISVTAEFDTLCVPVHRKCSQPTSFHYYNHYFLVFNDFFSGVYLLARSFDARLLLGTRNLFNSESKSVGAGLGKLPNSFTFLCCHPALRPAKKTFSADLRRVELYAH